MIYTLLKTPMSEAGRIWIKNSPIISLFQKKTLALLSSLLFLVHPVHSAAVNYISGRANPLSSLFIICTIIFYIRYSRKANSTVLLLTLISYCLALLSQENSLIVPGLLLLYHISAQQKIRPWGFSSLIILSLIYLLVRFLLMTSLFPSIAGTGASLLGRVPGFFVALINY